MQKQCKLVNEILRKGYEPTTASLCRSGLISSQDITAASSMRCNCPRTPSNKASCQNVSRRHMI